MGDLEEKLIRQKNQQEMQGREEVEEKGKIPLRTLTKKKNDYRF